MILVSWDGYKLHDVNDPVIGSQYKLFSSLEEAKDYIRKYVRSPTVLIAQNATVYKTKTELVEVI